MLRPKYFTPKEVSLHNTLGDIWVSYLGKVYNLTPLEEEYKGKSLILVNYGIKTGKACFPKALKYVFFF